MNSRTILLSIFAWILISTVTRAQPRSVFTTTGDAISANSFTAKLTLGEPLPGAILRSTSYTMVTGFYTGGSPVSIAHEDEEILPTDFELDQNYPNPFNPATSIRYGLAEAATVSLRVFNLLGQEVATLVEGEIQNAGYHTKQWNARRHDGSVAPSGLYVYQLRIVDTSSKTQRLFSRKMLLVR